jgi:hypothetical protein
MKRNFESREVTYCVKMIMIISKIIVGSRDVAQKIGRLDVKHISVDRHNMQIEWGKIYQPFCKNQPNEEGTQCEF